MKLILSTHNVTLTQTLEDRVVKKLEQLDHLDGRAVDARVTLITLAISVFTIFACGLAPPLLKKRITNRALIVAESDTIGRGDLGLPVASGPTATPVPPFQAAEGESVRLDDIEQHHIRRVLELAGGSKTRAAAMLGVSRSTLWEKTKKYGIE